MPNDTFNLNQDMAEKKAVPNKWLKYLIFLRGASYSEYGEFEGSSESFISYIWDFFTQGAGKSHHCKSLKMNYQFCKQPREGFIFKTGMIIADICATTVEKYLEMCSLVALSLPLHLCSWSTSIKACHQPI